MPLFAFLRRRPGLALLLVPPLLVLGWLTARPRPDPDAGKLRVTVLDVGQGDCILVETPTRRVMLVDGGGSSDESQVDSTDIGLKTVVPFLHYQGYSHLDVVVLTHPHGDHCGGLTAVLREESVGSVLDGTVLPYPSADYAAFRQEIRDRHIPYQHAARGMRLDFGDGVTADVLNPPAAGTPYGTQADNATVNNYSAVLRLTYGRTHVLLTADAETTAEENMMASVPDLSADVLKAGHHGAANATGDPWLLRVRPRYAAISCGARNPFGHPSPDTLARLAAHGVQTFRTDKNGAVTFLSDGHTVIARPFLPGQ